MFKQQINYKELNDANLKSKLFNREAVLYRKICDVSKASYLLADDFEPLQTQANGNVEATARLIGARQLLDDCFLHKDIERNIIAINALF